MGQLKASPDYCHRGAGPQHLHDPEMTPDEEPKTDAELARRLRALYDAGEHSRSASDDFWDCISHHIGWIVDLVEKAAKTKSSRKAGAGQAGGIARANKLSPERRAEIAKAAANARWNPS